MNISELLLGFAWAPHSAVLTSANIRGVPRIERGGVHVAIGGMICRLGSVVIRSTFGVRMRALYQGGVRAL